MHGDVPTQGYAFKTGIRNCLTQLHKSVKVKQIGKSEEFKWKNKNLEKKKKANETKMDDLPDKEVKASVTM